MTVYGWRYHLVANVVIPSIALLIYKVIALYRLWQTCVQSVELGRKQSRAPASGSSLSLRSFSCDNSSCIADAGVPHSIAFAGLVIILKLDAEARL